MRQVKNQITQAALKRNKSHVFGAMHLKEIINLTTCTYNQKYHASGLLRMCSKSWRFLSFFQLTEG